jgi:hypothetical protein
LPRSAGAEPIASARTKEAAETAESVQRAVAQTALVEVGAIGGGALLVAILRQHGRSRRLDGGAVATWVFYLARPARGETIEDSTALRARLAQR